MIHTVGLRNQDKKILDDFMYVEFVYVLNDFRCKTHIKSELFQMLREKKILKNKSRSLNFTF